ncbi:pirin family protein [Aciditerrimonas ferrireducens]|jgi:redox-sensitive bicupin YhaK (pirin superfamily)|uniref:pirin family protein n=1 Tax=Aciditerrimonas ferrireducens TaxID=667306 RepID=UPI002003ECAB|nr:pirin family protein [Aciditerrimonas ferrireducens]MCK4176462.1 pirin family protein [Aciditerrimonas ferrireducens]
MSGPLERDEAATGASPGAGPGQAEVELFRGRATEVGGVPVTRLLPQRARRSVGPWCFLDLLGPVSTGPGRPGLAVPPHPHCGLQTVTWLLHGEVLHRDSLGSEQVVRPGELSLMTAGHGVAHAEEPTGRALPRLQGAQLWIAQPAATAGGAAAFEHHVDLPVLPLPGGGQARVLVGELAGARSPARRDTPHLGAELRLPAGSLRLPVRAADEHGLCLLAGGPLRLGLHRLEPGVLAVWPPGRDVVTVEAERPAVVLLLGGPPFEEPLVMWWNFVGRSRVELAEARRAWEAGEPRFGPVRSALPRLVAPPLPWDTAR